MIKVVRTNLLPSPQRIAADATGNEASDEAGGDDDGDGERGHVSLISIVMSSLSTQSHRFSMRQLAIAASSSNSASNAALQILSRSGRDRCNVPIAAARFFLDQLSGGMKYAVHDNAKT